MNSKERPAKHVPTDKKGGKEIPVTREFPHFKIIRFTDLAADHDVVQIDFEGTLYFLRKTRNGGLVLYK